MQKWLVLKFRFFFIHLVSVKMQISQVRFWFVVSLHASWLSSKALKSDYLKVFIYVYNCNVSRYLCMYNCIISGYLCICIIALSQGIQYSCMHNCNVADYRRRLHHIIHIFMAIVRIKDNPE